MAADLAGRLINPPFETPFGILMAFDWCAFSIDQDTEGRLMKKTLSVFFLLLMVAVFRKCHGGKNNFILSGIRGNLSRNGIFESSTDFY